MIDPIIEELDEKLPSPSPSPIPDNSVNDNQITFIDNRTPYQVKKDTISGIFTIIFSGIALGSDGYQNSIMNLTNVVLRKQFGKEIYNNTISTRVTNALLIGAIIGQLSIGVIVDRIGRKTGLIITTLLIVLGSALTAASSPINHPYALLWMFTISRGITGIGVGGEYPAASTSAQEAASESTITSNRGKVFILVTHVTFVIGGVLSIIIYCILLAIFGENNPEPVWRIAIGLGTILPLSVLWFRLKISMSKLYREGAMQNRVPYKLILKKYKWRLLGTAGTWFLFDIIIFPNNLFSATIISSAVKNGSILSTAEWQLLISALAIPGSIAGAYLVDKIGRRKLLMLGFGGFMILGLIIGGIYDKVINILPLFIILYGIFISVGSAGPGDLEGLISSESFPTSVRGTCYGISAAFGKLGAVVGTYAFNPLASKGQYLTFLACGGLAFIGILITYFFVEDMTYIDFHKEDQELQIYLALNGWKGKVGCGEYAHDIDNIDQKRKNSN